MSKSSVLRPFVKNLYCEIEDIQIGKEEIKLLLFIDDMFVFIENLKESTKNAQQDCKIQEYTQKPHFYILTNIRKLKFKIPFAIPFTVASKKMK